MAGVCSNIIVFFLFAAQVAALFLLLWLAKGGAQKKKRSERARRALRIAQKHGFWREVEEDIRHHGDPREALIEWDLDWQEFDREEEKNVRH